jgi:putative ABC transport system substrate-binding protein
MKPMRRREFIACLGGAAAGLPLGARAQQPEQIRRIGILQGLAASDPEWQPRLNAFKQRLRELGWIEGHNVAFEYRYADAKPERLPALAVELVQANIDVLVTNAAQPIEAARKATSTIPIVMASTGDAVAAGYVASLAHPGGNITGQTLVATDQSAKRLQLVGQILPGISRVAVLWNGNASGHRLQLQEMELAAPTLGITLQSLPNANINDIAKNLAAAVQADAQIIVTMDDPLLQSQRERIVEFAMRQRLPVVGEFRSTTDAGGLMSYGPNQVGMWRHAADYVDKILRGTKPADLPVEQPTKFEFVLNLKTAKALGITIPPGILAIADEVIE